MDEDYVVFLHLRTADADAPALQGDAMPFRGGYPTSLWVSGEVVVDTHTLASLQIWRQGLMLYVGFYAGRRTAARRRGVPLRDWRRCGLCPGKRPPGWSGGLAQGVLFLVLEDFDFVCGIAGARARAGGPSGSRQ